MRVFVLICVSLFFAACGSKNGEGNSPVDPASVLALTTTGSISAPEAIVQTTYVPNNVATWASAILMRGESGAVWRTTTEEYPASLISKGPYSDIYGLARKNAAGVFLALTPEGDLKAFAETNDTGDFGKTPISYGGPGILNFCAGNPADNASDDFWALGADKKLHKLTAGYSSANVAEIAVSSTISGPKYMTGCISGPDGGLFAKSQHKTKITWYARKGSTWKLRPEFSDMHSLSFLAPDIALGKGAAPDSHFIIDGQTPRPFTIEGGLSILGLSSSRSISATPLPMGSVYSDGLITISDMDDDRLVLISGAYALHQLQLSGQ